MTLEHDTLFLGGQVIDGYRCMDCCTFLHPTLITEREKCPLCAIDVQEFNREYLNEWKESDSVSPEQTER